MRKRVVGVGAVILVALGAMLGFRGFGTGENETESEETGNGTVQVSLTETGQRPVLPTPDETDDTTPATGTTDVLTLLVDDDRYLIQQGEDAQAGFAPATLEEIAERANATPGNDVGVRVRLRFRENAQNGAISDLKAALTEAGLDPEAIIEESGYVE